MQEETISVSKKQSNRVPVLEELKKKRMSLVEASEYLGISSRQMWRLFARYSAYGLAGLVHGNRLNEPANKISVELKKEILRLFNEEYRNYNDTHFTEVINEAKGIKISREAVRNILRSNGIPPKRKRKAPKHRRWRERKSSYGQLVLWDGSLHRWFGEASESFCLMSAVDDASSSLLAAMFVKAEGSVAYLRLLDMLLRRHGVPLAIYHDRHTSLVRSDNSYSHEETLLGRQYPTHVGRVLEELSIRSILAYSPQAKGRVERAFGTLQDRLIAEMETAKIKDIDSANKWLIEVFIERYNKKFAVSVDNEASSFRSLSIADIEHYISFAYEAIVGNDNCVRLGGLIIPIPKGKGRDSGSYAKKKVFVRQHLDGSWSVWDMGRTDRDSSSRVAPICVAKHPSTPFREPFRSYKKKNIAPKGEGRREVRIAEQLYENPRPAIPQIGHFPFAEIRTF